MSTLRIVAVVDTVAIIDTVAVYIINRNLCASEIENEYFINASILIETTNRFIRNVFFFLFLCSPCVSSLLSPQSAFIHFLLIFMSCFSFLYAHLAFRHCCHHSRCRRRQPNISECSGCWRSGTPRRGMSLLE